MCSSEMRQEMEAAEAASQQFWKSTITRETILRFWLSVSEHEHRTMICVLLWTARQEFHGGEARARVASKDISRKLRIRMGDRVTEELMVLLKRYSPTVLLRRFHQLEIAVGKCHPQKFKPVSFLVG
jgi:hypothetical protein